MTTIPDELKYTADHEWLRVEGDTATIGITAVAAERLGDIVFVELPEPGATVRRGKVIGELESTKSVGELFSPVDGTVVAANDAVTGDPALVNADPYDSGWLVTVRLDADLPELLDAEQYRALIADEGA